MDVEMPVMDGIQATKLIRSLQRPDAKAIPIIAITADITHQTMTKCTEAGMNDCISKPVDQAKLFTCLAREIDKNS